MKANLKNIQKKIRILCSRNVHTSGGKVNWYSAVGKYLVCNIDKAE